MKGEKFTVYNHVMGEYTAEAEEARTAKQANFLVTWKAEVEAPRIAELEA